MKVMKVLLVLAGGLAMAAAASAAPADSGYGVQLTSRLAMPQYMTIETQAGQFCAGEVSSSKPLRCPDVVAPPTMVKVVWGPVTSFKAPATTAAALPAGWKSIAGPTQQASLAAGWLRPPWWFRRGDVVLFTINRMHRLSVTYQCDRSGHACVSYTPVTVFGHPQGVMPLAP